MARDKTKSDVPSVPDFPDVGHRDQTASLEIGRERVRLSRATFCNTGNVDDEPLSLEASTEGY